MSAIVLFGSRISPFVEKVARGLGLKKLAFELVEPASPLDLRKWNRQTGKMPVLDLDGERLYDSTFILRTLDERFPSPPLLADDPHLAAAQRQLEDWADESLYWYLMALRWSDRNAAATAEQITGSAPALLRPVVRAIVPWWVGRMPAVQGLGRLPYDVLVRELGGRLDDLVRVLGDRPFFYDDRPGVADLAVYGQLHMARSGPTPEVDGLIAERAALVAHMQRVEQATTA